jgi:hypothetical protein
MSAELWHNIIKMIIMYTSIMKILL